MKKKYKVIGPHNLIMGRITVKVGSIVEIEDDKTAESLIKRKLIAPVEKEEKKKKEAGDAN